MTADLAALAAALHADIAAGDIAAAAALADLCEEHGLTADGPTHNLHCAGTICRTAVKHAAKRAAARTAELLRQAASYLAA